MWCCVVLFLAVLHVLGTNAVFHYTDCAPASSQMHVNKLTVSPDPIVLPGTVTVTVDGATNGRIDHAQVQVVLKKKHAFFGTDFKVPCIDNFGSCNYSDVCTILDDMERGNWGHGLGANISRELKALFTANHVDYSCPLGTGRLQLQNYVISLPAVPHQFSLFADGDYYGEIKLADPVNGNVLFCFQADISIKQGPPCTGTSCTIPVGK